MVMFSHHTVCWGTHELKVKVLTCLLLSRSWWISLIRECQNGFLFIQIKFRFSRTGKHFHILYIKHQGSEIEASKIIYMYQICARNNSLKVNYIYRYVYCPKHMAESYKADKLTMTKSIFPSYIYFFSVHFWFKLLKVLDSVLTLFHELWKIVRTNERICTTIKSLLLHRTQTIFQMKSKNSFLFVFSPIAFLFTSTRGSYWPFSLFSNLVDFNANCHFCFAKQNKSILGE